MTGIERIQNILQHKAVDRIGLYEHFWADTLKRWTREGHMEIEEKFEEHFDLDIIRCRCINTVADIDFVPEIVEETEETVLTRDGNGAMLRTHKIHDTTPEHVDFMVKDRKGWQSLIEPKLMPALNRINVDLYRNEKLRAREKGCFFAWDASNVFEVMNGVCGTEYLLMGMAADPDWIADMAMTYANLYCKLTDMLFSSEGLPDAIWWYEDMGFKHKPFFSPEMYREILWPAHKVTFDIAKKRNLPVIVHSCGYIEPLIPGLIEAGMDCLQVIEVKAGMDLLKLFRQYGSDISFMGGIDARVLTTNDKAVIDQELE